MIGPGWASNPDSPTTIARQRVLRRYQQRHQGRLNIRSTLVTKYYCINIVGTSFSPRNCDETSSLFEWQLQHYSPHDWPAKAEKRLQTSWLSRCWVTQAHVTYDPLTHCLISTQPDPSAYRFDPIRLITSLTMTQPNPIHNSASDSTSRMMSSSNNKAVGDEVTASTPIVCPVARDNRRRHQTTVGTT